MERQGALNVAQIIEEAFDGLSEKGAPLVAVVLAVAALTAGVAASSGSSLALTLSFVGGGAGVAGAATSGGEEEMEIGGGSVDEAIASMESALDTLEFNVPKAEIAVAAAIRESYGEVNSALNGDVAAKSNVLTHQHDYHGPNITDGVEMRSTRNQATLSLTVKMTLGRHQLKQSEVIR